MHSLGFDSSSTCEMDYEVELFPKTIERQRQRGDKLGPGVGLCSARPPAGIRSSTKMPA
jgi:hypothetical protein